MQFATISFYRYTPIDTPEKLREYFKALCESLSVTGRILIATEGINAAVSGRKENITKFKQCITKHPLFGDLTFREQDADTRAHHKLIVRVRKEIVHFGTTVDVTQTGIHLSPRQLQQWHEQKEDFVMVDARNEYEYEVGRFKNAKKLPIKNFREFADVAPTELAEYKNKKIVLYCTGGGRCEKASAYLKEQGFTQVYQVEGGIINYVNQFSDYWEGGLFVFDDRLVSEVGDPVTTCVHCGVDCEHYLNCHNLDCDRLFACCSDCQEKYHKNCSEECAGSHRQRKELKNEHKKEIIGVVENYYGKIGVALVKVEKEKIHKNSVISVMGKTTHFTQEIAELYNEEGNVVDSGAAGECVTFPVSQKVRKNDRVMLG